MLLKLMQSDVEDEQLVALQICFDLSNFASQAFLREVSEQFKSSYKIKASDEGSSTHPSLSDIQSILDGSTATKLYRRFLAKHKKSDFRILDTTFSALEGKSSIYHSSISISHAFMSAGTSNDTWLRSHLPFLGRARNWAKFTATAALGVVHKGDIEHGRELLKPYLPKEDAHQPPSLYSEGGALYALGLIHANHGSAVVDYLLAQLQRAGLDEVIQHGACLGVGVACMGSGNEGQLIVYAERR